MVAAVLIIWGGIALKINSGLRSNLPVITEATSYQSFTPIPFVESDSFSIEKLDRDPFLGTFSKPPKVKSPQRIPPKPKPLKQITYSGIVQKTNSKTPVFVITINNHEYLVKKGQTVDSVTLVSGTAKKIIVRYNRALQTINRP